MKKNIVRLFQESIHIKEEALQANLESIENGVAMIKQAFEKGHRLFLFGNGGSAADSQHIAAEFIGRFQKERKSLPAIALTTDTSIITALGNDYSFDIIFSRQLEGLASTGDIAWGLSTSGNSSNVIEGIKTAKRLGLATVSFTGGDGGDLAKLTDVSIKVPSKVTARVQEAHICMAHIICDLVESFF